MPEPGLNELEEQHYQEARRRWSSKPTSELVHEFAVVRGNLSEDYARQQLAALLDLKMADAQRAAVVEALTNAADAYLAAYRASWPTDPTTVPYPCRWLIERANAIENGTDW